MTLSEIFSLVSDEREKPFGWSWQRDALPLDLPSLGNSEALAFALIVRYLKGLLPGTILAQLEPYFRVATSRLGNLPAGAPCSGLARQDPNRSTHTTAAAPENLGRGAAGGPRCANRGAAGHCSLSCVQ